MLKTDNLPKEILRGVSCPPDDLFKAWLVDQHLHTGSREIDFRLRWGETFMAMGRQMLAGRISLNHPDVALEDLLDLAAELINRIYGIDKEQAIMWHWSGDYTQKHLHDAEPDAEDWVSLWLRSKTEERNGTGSSLFGANANGVSYQGLLTLVDRLTTEATAARPQLQFNAATLRQYILSILPDLAWAVFKGMHQQPKTVEYSLVCLDMSGSLVDGDNIPGAFLTDNTVVLNTNPRYASLPFSGFGLTAELKKRAQV